VSSDPSDSDETLLRHVAPAAVEADPVQHFLELEPSEGTEARRVELGTAPLTIGRTEQSGLMLPSPDVSRSHCIVVVEDGAAVVTDLGSTNGTIVDGERTTGPTRLTPGSRLRLGPFTLSYRSGRASDLARAEEVERDLARAGRYVEALLPEPIEQGRIRADWRFVPSARIGGDGFGYGWIDDDRFAVWLLDVAGHGAGSALLAASVMDVLRARALPDADFTDPVAVLEAANARFQMDQHGGLFFTLWYGVCDLDSRRLSFGCAGHHPAFLLAGDAEAQPLHLKGPPIGAIPEWSYRRGEADLPPEARLHLFSDGAFELISADGRDLGLPDFLPHLASATEPGVPEPERLLRVVRMLSRAGPLDDDVSLLTLEIP
jgi:hypothetical protein